MSQGFNHFDENGNAVMVDVSGKKKCRQVLRSADYKANSDKFTEKTD